MNIDLSNVPNKPGVYLWKNKVGKVIYIGKAKELNNKMQQYFSGNLSPKNKILLKNIADFEIHICENEYEAINLETELIEQYEPLFNIKIKSAKIYPYIEVKYGPKIKLTVTKYKKAKRAKYYGPYIDGKVARSVILLLVKLFDINDNLTKTEQRKIMNKIDEFHRGDLSEAYSILNKLSEKGKNVQDDILLLRNIDLSSEVIFNENINLDVINYFVNDDLISISMTYIRSGVRGITANFVNKLFNPYPEDALVSFLTRFYSRNPIPDQIIIPNNTEWDLEFKANLATPSTEIIKKVSMETLFDAESKISRNVEGFIGRIKHYASWLEFMRNNIGFRSNINLIEMMTIVRNGKGNDFGIEVQYLEGKKRIDGYKKYILNESMDIDELIKLHIEDKKANNLMFPDVLIVNGTSELLSAIKIYKEFGIRGTSIIAIDNKQSAVIDVMYNDVLEEQEIIFNSHIYNFLSMIKNELRKFGNSFHRSRIDNTLVESKLDGFKFLNEIDKQKLVKEFKSIKKIMLANEQELGKVLVRAKIKKLIKEREK